MNWPVAYRSNVVFIVTLGHSPFYAVSVNCLYRDRVSGRVTDRVRFIVRRPDSSGNF